MESSVIQGYSLKKAALSDPDYINFFIKNSKDNQIGYIILNQYLLTNPDCAELKYFLDEHLAVFTEPPLDVTSTYSVFKIK